MTELVEVWLYGSRARGTADIASDTDVLVVSGSEHEVDLEGLAYPRIAVSHYVWSEIEAMWSYGSLFLHHVKTEGVRLSPKRPASSRLAELLDDLPSFARASHDLLTFQRAADEARQSLINHGWPDLELKVMATVVRHAAILGSYCVAEPDYGRESPFVTVGAHLGWEVARLTALGSLASKFRYLPLGDSGWVQAVDEGLDWLGEVETFLFALEPVIRGYERLLHRAA